MRVKEQMLFYWVQSVDLNGQILNNQAKQGLLELRELLKFICKYVATTVVKGASSLSPLKARTH